MTTMYKINTIEKIKDIEGVAREESVGYIISNALGMTKTADPMKSFLLGMKFAQNDSVELDTLDVKYLKEIIKEASLAPFISGQILVMLEDLKLNK